MKLIYIFIFLVSPLLMLAENYYYPKTEIFYVSAGIYYDNPDKINSLLSNNMETGLLQEHVYYLGIGYKQNHNPISKKPYFLLYSIDFKFPLTRRTNNVHYNTELQTYSLTLEVSTFESYVKTVTIHPILGLAFSKTDLLLPLKYIDSEKRFYPDSSTQKYEKYTAALNLGGGADLRIKLKEFDKEIKNLLISFNVRYSISLEEFDIFDKRWIHASRFTEEIPAYIGPGLSIELNISIENQRK